MSILSSLGKAMVVGFTSVIGVAGVILFFVGNSYACLYVIDVLCRHFSQWDSDNALIIQISTIGSFLIFWVGFFVSLLRIKTPKTQQEPSC